MKPASCRTPENGDDPRHRRGHVENDMLAARLGYLNKLSERRALLARAQLRYGRFVLGI